MRTAGFALLGLFSGAILGLICAFLFVMLWYDVLRMGSHGPDGLGGTGALIALGIILPLLGGIAGAVWMGARGRSATAGPSMGRIVVQVLLPLLFLFVIIMYAAV